VPLAIRQQEVCQENDAISKKQNPDGSTSSIEMGRPCVRYSLWKSPGLIAETVVRAATDGIPQLRYPAGPDATQLLEQRTATNDAAFFSALAARFGSPS